MVTVDAHPYVHTRPARALSDKVRGEVDDALKGPSLAVMVYGSQARGSAEPASDVDVLQVVAKNAGSYQLGRVAVTAYTPAHLHQMATHGSLFVLHLREEGVCLVDEGGVLARALRAYRPPPSYGPMRRELRAAAQALAVKVADFKLRSQPMGRLGIYLLRTALYVEAAERGFPTFDVDLAAKRQGYEHLGEVLALRRSHILSLDEALAVRGAVLKFFNLGEHDSTLESLAVGFARTRPHASALIAQVISTAEDLDYAGLPLPPL